MNKTKVINMQTSATDGGELICEFDGLYVVARHGLLQVKFGDMKDYEYYKIHAIFDYIAEDGIVREVIVYPEDKFK